MNQFLRPVIDLVLTPTPSRQEPSVPVRWFLHPLQLLPLQLGNLRDTRLPHGTGTRSFAKLFTSKLLFRKAVSLLLYKIGLIIPFYRHNTYSFVVFPY